MPPYLRLLLSAAVVQPYVVVRCVQEVFGQLQDLSNATILNLKEPQNRERLTLST